MTRGRIEQKFQIFFSLFFSLSADRRIDIDLYSIPVSIWLVLKERYYFLPSTPARGHGLIALQFRVCFCIVLLIRGQFINVLIPIYNQKIGKNRQNKIIFGYNQTQTLTCTSFISVDAATNFFRWHWILIYVGFNILQESGTGSMVLLNNLRSFLWIRVQQHTTRQIEVELFAHLHSLSLRWYLARKTGEVLRVTDRGTDSINNLLNYILFLIAPTIIDILIAIAFFTITFNWYFGVIVFITMVLFIGE